MTLSIGFCKCFFTKSVFFILKKGAGLECNGFSIVNRCCEGHLGFYKVGPNVDNCHWNYTNYGVPIECGRNDEVVAGRCGSGQFNECPNNTSHGILCCELTVLE